MSADRIEWAGVPFLSVGLHDGRMLRAPGLYGFSIRRMSSPWRRYPHIRVGNRPWRSV
jgi:hypothetical protein